MIQEIITNIELDVKYQIYTEQKKLVAIKNLKEILSQVDHEVEVVPYRDRERLSKLLVLLKGQALSDEENRMLERIVDYKNEKEEVFDY